MPIHLASISRRTFLRSATSMATAVLVLRDVRASQQADDSDFLAMLADTHVPSDRTISNDGANMTENLELVIGELRALETKPAGIVIDGDCAFLKGLADDYKNLAQILGPLLDARLPVHLTMGNHDNRQRMYEQLQQQRPEKPVVEGKHVSVLELPRANWFLLDSLFETDVVTGELGETQLGWLRQTLDAHSDKPAIIMAHHNPEWQASGNVSGLRETTELFQMLVERKHVKAYVFGHTHRWEIKEHQGIHLVNLPPAGYVFDKAHPTGWVAAHVRADGITLQINTLDKSHKENARRVELAWR